MQLNLKYLYAFQVLTIAEREGFETTFQKRFHAARRLMERIIRSFASHNGLTPFEAYLEVLDENLQASYQDILQKLTAYSLRLGGVVVGRDNVTVICCQGRAIRCVPAKGSDRFNYEFIW